MYLLNFYAYYRYFVNHKSIWFADFCRGLAGSHLSVDSREAKEKFSETSVISHDKLASTGSFEHSDGGKLNV